MRQSGDLWSDITPVENCRSIFFVCAAYIFMKVIRKEGHMKKYLMAVLHWGLSFISSISVLYIVNSMLSFLQLGAGIGINYLTVGICAFLGIPGVAFSYAAFYYLGS